MCFCPKGNPYARIRGAYRVLLEHGGQTVSRQGKGWQTIRGGVVGLAFVLAYVALDWASFLHPLYGLNITPWNPSPALGLVLWLRAGRRAALPWFIAILVSEVLVRHLPASLPMTFVLAMVLTAGYGVIAEVLRHALQGRFPCEQGALLRWLGVVVTGTLVLGAVYISVLLASELVPVNDWMRALVRFWIGDGVGIVVTMPFFWLLAEGRLRGVLRQFETLLYMMLAVLMLWVAFGLGGQGEFQFFYLLCLPLVCAAARQGVPGAAVSAFVLQAGIIVAVQWQNMVEVTVFELQALGMALAFVGLFIGTVVDERGRLDAELRQSLRLAAAGEMAAALAHELNQPLTALGTYGAACEHLLDQEAEPARLREVLGRMVGEARRAAEVVRRLRDFFRTGATRLETVSLAELFDAVAQMFAARAAQDGVSLVVTPGPAVLLADALQLQVVLRNLVDNAFDAVSTRAPGERAVSLTAQPVAGGMVRIVVQDSGPGIAPEQAGALFEAFRSSKSSGLGLGLTISRAIARAHGGDLAIMEQAGGGTFVLSLPVDRESMHAA